MDDIIDGVFLKTTLLTKMMIILVLNVVFVIDFTPQQPNMAKAKMWDPGAGNVCNPVQEYVMFAEEANSEGCLLLITIFSIISVVHLIRLNQDNKKYKIL